MTRRYDEPVEVRRRDEDPTEFLWHGRLYVVRAVLAHWVETGPWWQSPGVRAVVGDDEPEELLEDAGGPVVDLMAEREMWRVEAGRGAADGENHGVFDLSFSWSDGRWQLVGCAD